MRYEQQRRAVAAAAQQLLATRLVVNTAGNVSQRAGENLVITPSSIPYNELTPADIAVVTLDGEVIEGRQLPSSETPLHTAVYKTQRTVAAIVHTHSINATALSTLVDELPAIHYNVVMLGGRVPVAQYAPFGSSALATGMAAALANSQAALMRNHGATTTGATLDEAMSHAITLEWLCEVYLTAAKVGEPTLLTDAQLADVAERLAELQRKRGAYKQP